MADRAMILCYDSCEVDQDTSEIIITMKIALFRDFFPGATQHNIEARILNTDNISQINTKIQNAIIDFGVTLNYQLNGQNILLLNISKGN